MQLISSQSVRSWARTGSTKSPAVVATICPNCGAMVTLTLGQQHDDSNRGAVAATARCPHCEKAVHFWAIRRHGKAKDGSSDDTPEVYMHPTAATLLVAQNHGPDVPSALERAFAGTADAFNQRNYIATAVCARRTLEGIFKNRLPADKRNLSLTLSQMIDEVRKDDSLAAPLGSLAHAIREGGNLGAHFDPDNEPDEATARQMVELLDYLICFLYTLPTEIRKLQQSLGKE